MDVFLLADIGGTNARFALYDVHTGTKAETVIYQVRENPTLEGALNKFLTEYAGNCTIKNAAIAIAGPILGDIVKLTNSDWICDSKKIAQLIGTNEVHIFNDFEAIALAIHSLKTEETSVIQLGEKSNLHATLVMGPGTGLGVAALAQKPDGTMRAFATEAGHIRYAPANEREYKLIRLLSREYGFVTAENLISGPGLVNLYNANCMLVDKSPAPSEPADVVMRARQGDQLCRQVLGDFAAIFGSFAGSIALTWNALGGIYLTGGVLGKLGGDFDQERFLERFATNPNMSTLLSRMPVYRVQAEIPAFMGLYAYLKNLR